MVTILAGTFSFLHKGHRRLLDAAVATGDTIIVGITRDEFAGSRKTYNAPSYMDRAAAVS
ncbi:phosphopantetheine adenylyltransferase, partial [mine drainage metagenome]